MYVMLYARRSPATDASVGLFRSAVFMCADVRTRDRERTRQEHGAVPIPAGEGRI